VTRPEPTRHEFAGLRPEPLASYLAGLGLIRVLAEQVDPAATASWDAGSLVITSTVDDIASWLADEYVPTPVLSPWNNGSGFGPRDKEPKKTLLAVQEHPSPRLAPLREAIPAARDLATVARDKGWLTDTGKGGDKRRVVLEFRNCCPESLLPWIDAAVVLAGDDVFFPPLLGTGGNDGRLEFSTNFHQRLLDVLDVTGKGRARSRGWAHDLVTGTQTERLADAAVGQFDPAAAGGPGSSAFGAADSLVNPWGYVLLVEGSLLFAASAARRNEHGVARASIPFTVHPSPDGSASGAEGEDSRGEIWIPVWCKDFTLTEITQLFGEARASWHGHPARRAADFYAATRTLGVTRGVDQFVRYGLHRRNGLAYAATPLDRVPVVSNPAVRLLASVEDWPARLRKRGAPATVRQAVRHFDAAHLRYARDGDATALRDILASLTTLEQAAARSRWAREATIPRRDLPAAEKFLPILTERSCQAELRVAAGLASAAVLPGPDRARQSGRTMRQILLPVDPVRPPGQSRPTARWRDTPLVAGFGLRPLGEVLADVLAWRCQTAADESGAEVFRGVPTFRSGLPVPAADLHAFAQGRLNDTELDQWLRACLALDWTAATRWPWPSAGPAIPLSVLGLLHPLALGLRPGTTNDLERPSPTMTGHRPGPGPGSGRPQTDMPRLALRPDWANRLIAGQVDKVHLEVTARLHQAGWHTAGPLPEDATPLASGTQIAAALVPRCRARDATNMLLQLAIPLSGTPDSEQP
jgi:CRISPR-associated protein Csx17